MKYNVKFQNSVGNDDNIESMLDFVSHLHKHYPTLEKPVHNLKSQQQFYATCSINLDNEIPKCVLPYKKRGAW